MCIITDYFEYFKIVVVPIGISSSIRISVRAIQQGGPILRSCGRSLQPTVMFQALLLSVAATILFLDFGPIGLHVGFV